GVLRHYDYATLAGQLARKRRRLAEVAAARRNDHRVRHRCRYVVCCTELETARVLECLACENHRRTQPLAQPRRLDESGGAQIRRLVGHAKLMAKSEGVGGSAGSFQ